MRRLIGFLAVALLATSSPAHASSGRLDPKFAGGAQPMRVDFGGTDVATGALVQKDGKTVVFGWSMETRRPYNSRIAITRLRADGSLDRSFGVNGKRLVAVGAALAGALTSEGKIVIGGCSGPAGSSRPVLIRLTKSGSLDKTFGSGGYVFESFGDSCFRGLAVSKDGRIVAGGGGATAALGSIVVARYLPSGAVDESFGIRGYARRSALAMQVLMSELVLAADGTVMYSGHTVTLAAGLTTVEMFVGRLTTSGTPDATFGIGGETSIRLGAVRTGTLDGPTSGGWSWGDGLASWRTQFIYVTGSSGDGGFLARFNWDGTLDMTFGTEGLVRISTEDTEPQDVLVRSDGRPLVIATDHVDETAKRNSVYRFTTSGKRDKTFGKSGAVLTPKHSELTRLASTSSAVLAAGSYGSSRVDLAVARFLL